MIVGAFWLVRGFEYSYSVESPSDCPPAWDGEQVSARELAGRIECVAYVAGDWSTIPWGNRSGLWPSVADIWIVAGGFALWWGMEPWVARGF